MKLLILHASAGGGHRRAAEALAVAAAARGLGVVVRDILDFMPPLYRRTYARGYLALVRSAPELWGYLYAQSDRSAQAPLERRFRAIFNKLNALSFLRFLGQASPDAVICTHFLPLELIGNLSFKSRLGLPLFGVITDFAAHALWYCKGVDAYYVATEEAQRQLARKGQPMDRVIISGIPVLPAFAPGRAPRAARLRLGLRPELPAALILNGGFGVGPAPELIRACQVDPPHCQLLVVTGRNPRFEAKVRAEAAQVPIPTTVYGFVENIHELMDAADLVISKPGGLTMAEALAKGLPVMIVDPIPGQEQRNCEYLLEAGCAVRVFDGREACWKIDVLLRDRARLAILAANALRLGRPRAAQDILANVLARAGANPAD